MLDIKLIRENPELIKQAFSARNKPELLEIFNRLFDLDKKRRAVIAKNDEQKSLRGDQI